MKPSQPADAAPMTTGLKLELAANFLLRLLLFTLLFAWASHAALAQGLMHMENWGLGLIMALIGLIGDLWTARQKQRPSSWERQQVVKGTTWTPGALHHRADYPSRYRP